MLKNDFTEPDGEPSGREGLEDGREQRQPNLHSATAQLRPQTHYLGSSSPFFHICKMGTVIKTTPLVLLCGLRQYMKNASGCRIEGKFSLCPLEGAPTFSLTDGFSQIAAAGGCKGLGSCSRPSLCKIKHRHRA